MKADVEFNTFQEFREETFDRPSKHMQSSKPARICSDRECSFVGIVRDDSDNPLPGASVLARNIETGLERNDITDESGAYHIPFLPFGTYDLTAEISGFATLVKKDIQLDSGRTLTIISQ